MTEHTKLPWEASGQYVRDRTEHGVSIAYCSVVAGAGVCKDGKIRSFGVAEEEAKKNAAYIAKACNAFPDLVKALEECAAAFSTSPGSVGQCQAEISAEFQRRMDVAGRALAAVKGAPDHG